MKGLLTLVAVLPSLWYGYGYSQPLFAPPVNLGPKINSAFYEADPFWNGPRKRLYFVSTRDGSEDIWYSDWTDTGWTNAQKLGPQINSSGNIEHSPSVSPDGQKLFYVTFSRPGAQYPWDFWVSTWDSNLNDWGTPVELPCPVNTPGTEFSGKIAPDGRTLYFYSSQGSCDSVQQSGLLFSVFDSLTGWSRPQGLGSNVNTGNGSQYPSITEDSQWLYFDQFVSDGKSIFVSPWTGSEWGPAFDLRPQIGGRAGTPSISPSGDSLFFAGSTDLGGFGMADIFLSVQVPTDVSDEKKNLLPTSFELYQNYPNPFNGQTMLSFFASKSLESPVSLTIYNILGKPVRHLLWNSPATGNFEVIWDSRDNSGKEVASGVYLYELRVGNQRVVKKAVIIR